MGTMMEILFFIFGGFLVISKSEFIVKKVVQSHGDNSGKAENASRFNEIVVKWEVKSV